MRSISTSFLITVFIQLIFPAKVFCQVSRPNIVLIIADDTRYDSFAPNGGPSFFETPSIDRIANEGANFHNYYCTYSLCKPARATLFTGLYPHLHGLYDNTGSLKNSWNTIPEVLATKGGYHCGVIGKYHISNTNQEGFEYFFSTVYDIRYTNPAFNYNGMIDSFPGNITDIIIDSSSAYLKRVDTPFFVVIEHLAPHKPVTPQQQYEDIYDDEDMPIPANFSKFNHWFPSFLYDSENKGYNGDTNKLSKDLRKYYEGLKGVDENIDSVFSILTSRNLLGKTMIIFTGDNGAMYGEHDLEGKGLPYEPSVKLPLFIRYPAWFPVPKNYHDHDFFALNTDIFPTVVDAAKINVNQFDVQGVTLRKLVNGTAERDKFMYEKIKTDLVGDAEEDEEDITPSLRTVRTLHYKYTRYHCDYSVEEFFDLGADSLETKNLIHHPAYQAQIAAARITLDSLQAVLKDTIQTTIDTVHRHCRIIKVDKSIIIPEDTIIFKLGPNPAEEFCTLTLSGNSGEEEALITIYNSLGQVVYKSNEMIYHSVISRVIDISRFPQGIYYAEARLANTVTVRTLLKN